MTSVQRLTKWQGRLLLTLVVLVAFCVLAGLAEGVVRVRHWLKYGDLWGIEETYTKDSESGLRIPIANSQIGPIRINSLGYRSPEIAVPKPQGTIRLAFLGASTTYCAEVSSNEITWPHLVWQQLQRRLPRVNLDYVNGGVPGYTAKTSLRNLERRIKKLEPDVIIIYHGYNDLSANTFNLAVKNGFIAQRADKGLSRLSQYSLLWYLVEKNFRILSRQAEAQSTERKLIFDNKDIAKPFRADLAALVAASRQIADLVGLVTLSHRMRSDQTPQQKAEAAVTALYYMPYMSIEGVLDGYDTYNRVIRDIAVEAGTLFIDAEASIPGDSIHFADSVHFTDAGSRVMAERVADALFDSVAFQELILAKRLTN